jgi:parallel beta-helix repeat protein
LPVDEARVQQTNFRNGAIALTALVGLLDCQQVHGEADQPVLEIVSDTTLDPARTYGRVVIKASNITIDGRGACLIGESGNPARSFRGIGLSADHVSNVRLKNINARGWETGLKVTDASGWIIEDCDFSDNFHDPAFGWGENGRRGGIVLERVSRSTLRKNRANRVWDGCVLVDCRENLLADNDFSHTSNTCLKLWSSCRNEIQHNILSHGIRISPGEVHARDSACVLIESGSNVNRFNKNGSSG